MYKYNVCTTVAPPCVIVTFIIVNDRNEQCYISGYIITVTMPTGRTRFIINYIVHIVDVGDRIQL